MVSSLTDPAGPCSAAASAITITSEREAEGIKFSYREHCLQKAVLQVHCCALVGAYTQGGMQHGWPTHWQGLSCLYPNPACSRPQHTTRAR